MNRQRTGSQPVDDERTQMAGTIGFLAPSDRIDFRVVDSWRRIIRCAASSSPASYWRRLKRGMRRPRSAPVVLQEETLGRNAPHGASNQG